MSATHSSNRPGSVFDALFAPLDEDTRRRFRIGAEARAEEADVKRLADEARQAMLRADEARRRAENPLPAQQTCNAPKSPWQFRIRDWWSVAKSTLSETSEDRVTSVAGGVVFFGLLALFPALTALVSLYGAIADRAMILEHLAMLQGLLPEGAYQILEDQIRQITSTPQGALSVAGLFALLVALYSATGGTKAMMDALNIAFFTVESRGFLKKNLVAIGFTLGGIALIILMLGVMAVIPALLATLPEAGASELAVAWLRWPLMFGVLVLTLAALYRWGPNRPVHENRWRWVIPGALFAAVGLLVASMLFSWYVSNFANYNKTYGSLGAAVGLMMWLWIAAIVVMVGGELNSEIEQRLRKLNGLPDLRPNSAREASAKP